MSRRRQPAIRAAIAAQRNLFHPRLDVLEHRLAPGDALLSLLTATSIGTPLLQLSSPSRERPAELIPLALDTTFEVPALDGAGVRGSYVTRASSAVETNESKSLDAEDPALAMKTQRAPITRAERASSVGTTCQPMGDTIQIAAPFAALTAAPASVSDVAVPTLRKTSLPSKGPQNPPTQQRAPVTFEANAGQTDAQVHFLSRGAGYNLFLTSTEAVVRMHDAESPETSAVVRMQYLGANPTPQVTGKTELATKVNYYLGRDASQWHIRVSTYGEVEYQNLYPGVDLVYYGNAAQELEYDFVVSPGADPSAIKLGFEGADRVNIDDAGNLLLDVGSQQLRQHAPVTYQEVNGVRQTVSSAYLLEGNQIRFAVGAYDTARPLTIDPVISYSSYHGGNNTDAAESVTVDAAGNAYLVGWTNSTNFPSQNGAQKTKVGLIDAFVSKITPQGTVAFSTYYGGERGDYARGVAVDEAGTIYISGNTGSNGKFPVLNPYQGHYNRGKWDGFVAKFTTDGTLTYSSYLGGKGEDFARGIAVDASGNMYITGNTDSPNFPKSNAWQSAPAGLSDAFLTKLNADGQSIAFSTYLGGSLDDISYDVGLDASGNVHITGHTVSQNFPTLSAFQPAYGGGPFDGFVTKFNAAGSVVYSSYLGGNNLDRGFSVAVDPAGNAYYAGQTWSANFPTLNALQSKHGGSTDVFVMKVTPAGSRVYSTFLGGSSADLNWGGLAVNAAGAVYVSGGTESTNFPTVQPIQGAKNGLRDAFVSVINPTGTALTFSTFLGGNAFDDAYNLALDASESIYLVGETYSTDFPVVNPWQSKKNTFTDCFVTKISP